MLGRLAIQTLVYAAVLGGILCLAAGRVFWPQAWLFVLGIVLSSATVGLWLLRHDPALLEARLSLRHRDQAPWDRVFLTAAMGVFLAWIVVMGLDVRRSGASAFSPWVQGVGALAMAAAIAGVWRTFAANSFAVPQVRIQPDRGQRVVSDGPYRYVRHPMYAAAIVYICGVALLLGSRWGLVGVPVLAVGLAWRIRGEEETLRRELPGYDAYARRVRYRILPGLW